MSGDLEVYTEFEKPVGVKKYPYDENTEGIK
jgi:hypothetical protein